MPKQICSFGQNLTIGDLADVFAIENELAERIVSQLKSKLSPKEKAAIEQKPTADLVAHDLYIRAKTLIATALTAHLKRRACSRPFAC